MVTISQLVLSPALSQVMKDLDHSVICKLKEQTEEENRLEESLS